MKRIVQAVAVAALVLVSGIQAKAEDAPIVVPSQWTHADRAAPGGSAAAFPGSAPEMIVLESTSTRADGYAASIAREAVVAAFPGSAPEMIVLESQPSYADKFAGERNLQARGAADPALSE